MRVALIRKLQSTSDLDHFHAHEIPCSPVKSRDDPITGRRGDRRVPYSFIYRDDMYIAIASEIVWNFYTVRGL